MSADELTERDLEQRAIAAVPRDAYVIALEIARRHGVTFKELIGPRRYKHIVRARHELYRQLRELGWSLSAVGAFVGGRDHTTVLDGLRSMPARTKRRLRDKVRLAVRRQAHWLGPAGLYVDGLMGAMTAIAQHCGRTHARV